jgi:Ca2+/Na+ antiporter
MRRFKRYIEFIIHLVIISALLYKGYDEVSRGLYFAGGIILGLAAIAMVITLFWKQFKIPPRIARQTCYYIEAPALFVSAYVFYLDKQIAYFNYCIIAGLACCVVGYLSTRIKFS